ncbi:histidine kinase [Actinomyces sp. oral taxon 170]|uniref:sensor histidine kinase n=1 Tax=Actinomyces sp. oral taxon 170 TaxID=712117 RepID=UPI0020A08B45|nr:histidine kinase [Actinomyces sp. oral taxon 170]
MSSPTPPQASSTASPRESTGTPPVSSTTDTPGNTAASAARSRAGTGLPAALTNPTLLRAMIRSMPSTTSPEPTAPGSEGERKSPSRREQASQPNKSTSITTPWNDTLSAMPSQLPSPQSGRTVSDVPDEDEPELQPESRGLLRAISQWYHRHPAIADTLIALGLIALSALLGGANLLRQDNLTNAHSVWPLTFVVLVITGLVFTLRRRFPIWVWALTLLLPETYEITIMAVFNLTPEQLTLTISGLSLMVLLGVPIALGTIASHRRPLIAWTTWAATMGTFATEVVIVTPSPTVLDFLRAGMLYTLIATVGTLVGLNTRSARLRFKALEAHSTRMALASEQGALLAAAEERSRIAREMHDVVAHSLAVMITMADGAAATVERDPATAKQAMETLAEAGRSALADTRRLVGVLREDPSVAGGPPADSTGPTGPASTTDSISPQPPSASGQPTPAPEPGWKRGGKAVAPQRSAPSAASASSARGHEVRDVPVPEFAPLGTVTPVEPSAPIASLRQQATDGGSDRSRGDLPLAPSPEQADITELVKRFVSAGVPVSYRWVGAALPEDKALQLTVFRIAQEALTNVLRYAPTTPAVSVDVERHIGTVVLTVDNEAAPGTRPMHGSGKGLIGMRERASVYGGTVQAGPTPTGWRVRAVLRWDEHDEGTSSWQMPL